MAQLYQSPVIKLAILLLVPSIIFSAPVEQHEHVEAVLEVPPLASQVQQSNPEEHKHDLATQISSIFPVDPDELELSLHHGKGDTHRSKRQAMEDYDWVDDDGREYPEDLFHFYIKGGEGVKYGIETAPEPVIKKDSLVQDWFLSELGDSSKDESKWHQGSKDKNLDFVAKLGNKIPVHVVTKIDHPAVQNSALTDAIAEEVALENTLSPGIADVLAKEQSTDWQKVYKRILPQGDNAIHPTMFNKPTTLVLTAMSAFLLFMSGLAWYVNRPKHEERKERAGASKRRYEDEPPPAEEGKIALGDLEALLE